MKSSERPFVTVVQNSLEKLQSAFGAALPLTDNVDYNQIVYGQTNGWDSIAHMTLIAEIETQFDVMLTTEELIALSSFSKAKELLRQHGVTFA
jgi:acyl carrier protein